MSLITSTSIDKFIDIILNVTALISVILLKS